LIKITLDIEVPQELASFLKMNQEELKVFFEKVYNENMRRLYEATIALRSGVINEDEYLRTLIQAGAQKRVEFEDEREEEDEKNV